MTDKEKLEKIKRLADAMYNKMAYLTSDTRPIRQAMEDYHNFIVHEYNKDEQVDKPIDFEQELYNYFGQVKDFTLGMRIAKRFYDMGKNNQEPESEDLEEEIEKYMNALYRNWTEDERLKDSDVEELCKQTARHFTNWQKQKDSIVSGDLEEAAEEYSGKSSHPLNNAFKAGAKWQKEHLMKDAVDGEIGYWNLRWLSVNADLPRTVEEGDKVKVILIKEK